ncbi:TetR family transcriptional regulator [Rhodobacter viridis]|uniref:TetR family transcriptional regulator n=1 Tax=Rhodobacter viridis TaxID=1054202 RepID=A0A318U750_9RHOB|nr:TetR family transcriptional regulator [Rhodobacter viridis]PYF12734.1 TetR family transcriptional regulator [Rhodobacter viridis]
MEEHSPPQHYLRHETRREMIAAAAIAVILEKGAAALRTRDVAARVGINISTLHFHVATKSDMLRLVAETVRTAFEALLPPLPDPDRPAPDQLRAEVQAYHDSLRDRPELAACFAQLTQIAPSEPAIGALIEDFTRNWCARYVEILTLGRAQGSFRANLAPLPTALMITGALTAFGPRGPGGLAQFWPVFTEIERGLQARPKGGM